MQTVQLGIDLDATFDTATALSMTQAAKLMRGRRGHVAVSVLRRWASPKRGCVVNGVRLVLPAVKVGGMLLTMPAWVAAFERMRQRLGVRRYDERALPRPERGRALGHERACERLDAAGI